MAVGEVNLLVNLTYPVVLFMCPMHCICLRFNNTLILLILKVLLVYFLGTAQLNLFLFLCSSTNIVVACNYFLLLCVSGCRLDYFSLHSRM